MAELSLAMMVRSAVMAGLLGAAFLTSGCTTTSTLPVPQEILAEYGRGRPIIRLPLRYADGQPLRDARAYAGRFPDDGQIYMVGRGHFQLGPTTLLCIYNTDVEPAAQVPWRDSRILSNISEHLIEGVDEFIVDTIYSERRDEFIMTPDIESSDRRACSTSRDAVHIRSSALLGRQPRNHFIVVNVEQGSAAYTFFVERFSVNPPREQQLIRWYAEFSDGEEVASHDSRFLGMMVGYYTMRFAR